MQDQDTPMDVEIVGEGVLTVEGDSGEQQTLWVHHALTLPNRRRISLIGRDGDPEPIMWRPGWPDEWPAEYELLPFGGGS
jgi:hypothetical protein